jgi:uncharacterized protein (TIGR02757 family)
MSLDSVQWNSRDEEIKELLDEKVNQYNRREFIENDPILIPHSYTKKQDIEIAGFIASILAWGQRKTIINKCREFFNYMDNSPYDFILNHKEDDLHPFLNFKHRTFNATDALYFIHFFNEYYRKHDSFESAFHLGEDGVDKGENIGNGIEKFYKLFTSSEAFPSRTAKHVSAPFKKSACKRINMFLRWMVRKDDKGVDFGIWEKINPSQLVCPCDLHVDRVARSLGLIQRKQTDWQTAVELTENLKKYDPADPVKYDFALFGLGIYESAGY